MTDTVKNALASLNAARTEAVTRLKSIDGAIACLNAGAPGLMTPKAAPSKVKHERPSRKPGSMKGQFVGLSDAVNTWVESLPNGTVFTSAELGDGLPAKFAKVRRNTGYFLRKHKALTFLSKAGGRGPVTYRKGTEVLSPEPSLNGAAQ